MPDRDVSGAAVLRKSPAGIQDQNRNGNKRKERDGSYCPAPIDKEMVLVLVVGMALAVIASDTDDWNKEFDDRDQEAYLRKWNEQHKKQKDHTCR